MLDTAITSGIEDHRAIFEVFARTLPEGRRYGVLAGTGRLLGALDDFRFVDEQLEWLEGAGVVSFRAAAWLSAFRFTGDVDGYEEGEVFTAGSPVLTIEAPLGQALIVETVVLSILNADSGIATAAARMVRAAGGRPLIEMGSRRTSEGAAVSAARSAYIAGFAATSNLEAGRRFKIPTAGTSAHALTLAHRSEEEAFAAQVATLGSGTTLLVDTYDVEDGVRAAVQAAGIELGAVRIDSGDPVETAHRVRELLDKLGAEGTRIVVTGDLDEHEIAKLVGSNAPVDSFGVGTRLVSGAGCPAPGFVYKLVAVADEPGGDAPMRQVSKRSLAKETVGGRKSALRTYGSDGRARAELVYLENAEAAPDLGSARPLQVPYVRDGTAVCSSDLARARTRCESSLAELPEVAFDLSPGLPCITVELVESQRR